MESKRAREKSSKNKTLEHTSRYVVKRFGGQGLRKQEEEKRGRKKKETARL